MIYRKNNFIKNAIIHLFVELHIGSISLDFFNKIFRNKIIIFNLSYFEKQFIIEINDKI